MAHTIRFRLALWYALAFILSFMVMAWIVYIYVNRTLSDELDKSIRDEVGWVVSRLGRTDAHNEDPQVVRDDIHEHSTHFPIKEYLEIWTPDGQSFYRSWNLGEDTLYRIIKEWDLTSPLMSATFRGLDVRLFVQETRHYVIIIGMSTAGVKSSVDQLVTIFLWLCPFVLLIAIIGGRYVATRSLAKLNEVVETAQRITADRLHDRIPDHFASDEIGRIVSTFNEMISRLDVSFAQMKQFSADVSHELRTPLSVLRSQLETALNSRVDEDELNNLIANCLDETLHMSTVVDDLLLLATSDSGFKLLKQENVDLSCLVNEIYEESAILGSGKAITTTVDVEPGIIIMGDEQRLRQMLLNLVDNAIKYNREGGTIVMKLSRNNGMATLSIRDSGIGIDENEIPKIFDRFYRVDPARSRDRGGSGLGLSITKWIVEAHRGRIAVSSILNEGTEFLISLPILRDDLKK